MPCLSPQLGQQRPGLLQVGGVEPLSEPAIDLSQQLPGFGALALLLPQPSKAHRGPQFQRFGLLTTGDVKGLMKTGCSFVLVGDGLSQQQLSLESIQLRLPNTLPGVVYRR